MKPMPDSSSTMLAVITSEVSTRWSNSWSTDAVPRASKVASRPPAICW